MVVKRNRTCIALTGLFLTFLINAPGGAADFSADTQEKLGPRFSDSPRSHKGPRHPHRRRGEEATSALRYWSEVAIDASGFDHTPVAADEVRVFGEQLGPGAGKPRNGNRPYRDL